MQSAALPPAWNRRLGNAVVRITRRQVKHVAGLQHKLFFRLEILQNLQRHIFLKGQVFLPPDLPAPPAAGLQQKHVIAVEVRPHAAARGGKRDHQVVEPRVGDKAKLLQQCMRCRVMQIHTLHQQGPAFLAQGRQPRRGDWPLLHAPALGLLHDQA
jgi:hypothetical protein